jgi:RNA polymerase sigma-70 factor (ECF subfamily)
MESKGPTNQEPRSGASTTLGDVLYADREQALVSESEWVRIVHRVAERNPGALHSLYERTHHLVFTLAMRLTRDRETAEELTVDVFHDVWRRAPSYDPANGTVVGWIMNQARSRAIDRLRFENRKKRVNPYPDAPDDAGSGEDPHDAVSATDRGRALQDALLVLNEPEREAIEIAFFGDLTYAEVAERLHEPLGTIKTRVRSGLGKLRRALADSEVEP